MKEEELKIPRAVIKLTPDLAASNLKDEEAHKSIANFIITEDWLSYVLAIDCPSKTFINTEEEEVNGEFEFIYKKYESSIVLRKHIVGVTKTSFTEIDTDDKEAKYVHAITIDTYKSSIGLTCTWEEKNKYYPYLEDYYKGGDKWKELIVNNNE